LEIGESNVAMDIKAKSRTPQKLQRCSACVAHTEPLAWANFGFEPTAPRSPAQLTGGEHNMPTPQLVFFSLSFRSFIIFLFFFDYFHRRLRGNRAFIGHVGQG
jgi:hypothetical protein